MPRACAVEFLTSPLLVAGNRRQTPDSPKDATGLPGGVFTLAATSRQPPDSSRDATGLPGGVSRSPLLVAKPWLSERCHRLVRWSLTLAANRENLLVSSEDATGLPGQDQVSS